MQRLRSPAQISRGRPPLRRRIVPMARSLVCSMIGMMTLPVWPTVAFAIDTKAPEVITLASCQFSEVAPALTHATEFGGIVELPAGECDWGAGSLTLPVGSQRVELRGAGRERTIIRRTGGEAQSYALIFLCNAQSGALHFSGMSFYGNAADETESTRTHGISLTHSCRDFLIHDMRFSNYLGAGIEIEGDDAKGVIFNNRFHDNYNPDDPANGEGYGVTVHGDPYDPSGPRPPLPPLGSGNAVHIEDNCFDTNRHGIASGRNSFYVLRHNQFRGNTITRNTSMIDAHGATQGVPNGSRGFEIYDNLIWYDGSGYEAEGIVLRGGDGVIFGNRIGYRDAGSPIRYTVRLVVEYYGIYCPWNGPMPIDPSAAHPFREQTERAWIWNNTFLDDPNRPQIVSTSAIDAWNCGYYFQPERDYHLHAPNVAELGYAYQAFTYPHPLRRSADGIFADTFESTATQCF